MKALLWYPHYKKKVEDAKKFANEGKQDTANENKILKFTFSEKEK
jgi:hypothetical protein